MKYNIPYSPSRLDATLFFDQKLRRYFPKKLNILDVGCGKLYLYDFLSSSDFQGNYLGIDLQPKKIKKIGNLQIKIHKADFLEIKLYKKFDQIVCLWVLEHIKNDQSALLKIKTLLNKKGILIIAVPSNWTWPFEFGRHGFHYYSKTKLNSMFNQTDLKIVESYRCGGGLGFLFMLIYSWPRYLILIFILPIFFLLKIIQPKILWSNFSTNAIRYSWYLYHQFPGGIGLHNNLVQLIVDLDNKWKILPASYIYILKK